MRLRNIALLLIHLARPLDASQTLPSSHSTTDHHTPHCVRTGACACDTAHCVFNNLSLARPVAFCANNPTLAAAIASPSALDLFAYTELTVSSEEKLEVLPASDDYWFTDTLAMQSAVARASRYSAETSAFSLLWDLAWMDSLFFQLHALVESKPAGTAHVVSHRFSPFYSSCVAVHPRGGNVVRVDVSIERLPSALDRRRTRKSGFGSPLVWRTAALGLGLVLFFYARHLSRSLSLVYVSGISISMLLGVGIVLLLAWRRITGGGRRNILTLATVMGCSGSLTWAFVRQLETLWYSYWRGVLGYLAFFGILGYFLTFWMLKGGELEVWQSSLLERMLRLLAVSMLLNVSHSARASLALVTTAAAIALVTPLLMKRRGEPAPPPTHYEADATPGSWRKTRIAWRPPTESGAFLSPEEFERQGCATSKDELRKLVASPEYQAWLVDNHHRLKMDDADGASIPPAPHFDPDD